MLPRRFHFPFSFIVLFIPFFAIAQSHAGRDVIMCSSASARLGPEQPCIDCCYKWSPEIGLNDPNLPNPIVSGISTSHHYTVTVSFPDGHFETDDVAVNVYDVDLTIYHPEYAMPPNTVIPEALEEIPGAQTWVNLDNDDCDAEFDREDQEITGGDNEFIRLHALFTLSDFQRPGRDEERKGESGAKVNQDYFAVIENVLGTLPSGVILWKSNDKTAGIYEPGTPIALIPSATNPSAYEVDLWAEGTEGHVQQQQVKFGARLLDDRNGGCTDEFVSVTVLGIAKIEWLGIENGFTGNGLNNSNVLDADPNNALAVRVFPEAKMPGKNQPVKNKVELKVSFTTAPPAPEALYLRCFDIDDPSNEINFVDPNDGGTDGLSGNYAGGTAMNYSKDDDNRGLALIHGSSVAGAGTTGIKWGVLDGAVTQSVPEPGIYLKSNITTSSIDLGFYTSSNCGDNYRIAVHQDLKFIRDTRNRDIFDKQAIVNTCTGSPTGPCTEINPIFESPILTVWRTLHVEYDSMPNPGWYDNSIMEGWFSDFEGASLKKIIKIRGCIYFPEIDTLIIKIAPFHDGSNAILPGEKLTRGRFSGGGFRIGNPLIEIGLPNIDDVGNTSKILRAKGGYLEFVDTTDLTLGGTLTGEILKSGLPNLNFNILNITKNSGNFVVQYHSSQVFTSSYLNADVSLGGGPIKNSCVFQIDSINKTFTIPDTCLAIKIEVRDDDNIPLGGISTQIKRANESILSSYYNPIYIDIKFDGCGDRSNNGEVPFTRNIALQPNGTKGQEHYNYKNYINESSIRQSVEGEDYYWSIYILSCWQTNTFEDADPSAEGAKGGTAWLADVEDCNVADGGDFIIIPHSSYNELLSIVPSSSLEYLIAHEIGHCFGLSHGNVYNLKTTIPNSCLGLPSVAPIGVPPLSMVGIMTEGKYSITSNTNFIEYHKNIIRCRQKKHRRIH